MTRAAVSIVSCVSTTIEAAASISIDDLRTASNQIDTELAQIFAGVFAQHRTWRKAAAYTDALTACDVPIKACWELAEKAGYTTPGLFQSLIAENQWDHHEIWNRIATSVGRLGPCPNAREMSRFRASVWGFLRGHVK